MIALPWKKLCANFILPCGENHYGFFLRCPTSFYNRPRRSCCSTSRRNLSFCGAFSSLISNLQSVAPFLSAKRRWSLVRENQQSSAHNFVKDFSSFFPESRRRSPLKKGAVATIPLEYGKAEVQTLFEPLQATISSMELPKNFENKKLPNTLRRLAFLPFHL